MLAVAGGQIDLVELLLKGITAPLRNMNNNVNERRIKWVTLIAKVDTEAPDGITALKIARENGNAAIIQLLEKAAVAQKLAQEEKAKEDAAKNVAAIKEQDLISTVATEQNNKPVSLSSNSFFGDDTKKNLGMKKRWTQLIAKLSEPLTKVDQDTVKNKIKEFLIKNQKSSLPMEYKHLDNDTYFILNLPYASQKSQEMLIPLNSQKATPSFYHHDNDVVEWTLLLAKLCDTSSMSIKRSSTKEKIKKILINHPNIDLPMQYQSPNGKKIVIVDLYRPISSLSEKKKENYSKPQA